MRWLGISPLTANESCVCEEEGEWRGWRLEREENGGGGRNEEERGKGEEKATKSQQKRRRMMTNLSCFGGLKIGLHEVSIRLGFIQKGVEIIYRHA